MNPDFGQVEVDPAVVNLTAFETLFRENRPFFVAGSEVFQFGGADQGRRGGGGGNGAGGGTQLLYSRRIGGSPGWKAPSDAVYSELPEVATILAAAKLTGRTSGGWNVGILEAVTAQERAHYANASGGREVAVAAPLSNYFAGRAQKTLREGATSFGGMFTSVVRRLAGLDLVDELRSNAHTGGLDFRHEWAERAWALRGYLALSRVGGEASAIEDVQMSSARYLQRPDADHLTLDPTRTSLAGYTGRIELRKQAGLHWLGSAAISVISPGFEANNLGFQRDADRISANTSVEYVENEPSETFRNWNVQARLDRNWNHGWDVIGSGVTLRGGGQLLSYWNGGVRLTRSLSASDDRLTRGGPLARTPSATEVGANVRSDRRKALSFGSNGSYGWDAEGGHRLDLGASFGWRPSHSWNVELGPRYSRERTPAQYIGSRADSTASATFGRRYLFSELDQATLSLDARVNITFQPDLTLEMYAQPFIASADFEGVKALRSPGTFAFLRYGNDLGTVGQDGTELVVDPDGPGPAEPFRLDEGDFNRRSLRGNLVLRWEWRPGSTLFVVWQHQRSETVFLDDLDLGRDVSELFSGPSNNIFAVKLSYWFSP